MDELPLNNRIQMSRGERSSMKYSRTNSFFVSTGILIPQGIFYVNGCLGPIKMIVRISLASGGQKIIFQINSLSSLRFLTQTSAQLKTCDMTFEKSDF